MKPIRHTNILVRYDGVQVFEGRDAIGGHYVGVMIDDDGGSDRYLVAGVAPERLSRFRSGALDLRTLLLEAGYDEWFLADVGDDFRQPLEPIRPEAPERYAGFLPDEGFVLHDDPADDLSARETRARGNTVSCVRRGAARSR